MKDLPHVLFVVGPTACGKSEYAVLLSEQCKAPGRMQPEIINCDSVQFFDGVEIGSAKPSLEQMQRATHHLVSHVPKGDAYSAGDFRRDALLVVDERSAAGCDRFVAVGGSGFYVQALEKGMFDVPDIPPEIREEIEAELKEKGLGPLHAELATRDPESGKRIQPADTYRILRALEILRADPYGRSLSQIKEHFDQNKKAPPFRVSKIGIFKERDVLRTRVIERTKIMLDDGLIDEVRELRQAGLKDWAPLKSVGYAEVQAYLDHQLPYEELFDAIVTSTMQLAKRQMTWFKRDTSIRWFDSEKGWEGPIAVGKNLFDS